MNIKQLIILPLAIFTLASCGGDDSDDGTDVIFEEFMAAVEFNDANLETCVKSTIDEQGINQSQNLVDLACDEPITDVTGLQEFTKLTTLDLTANDSMSCIDIELVQKQLNTSAKVNGFEIPVDVIQAERCFYNELLFTDNALRECVIGMFNESDVLASTDDVTSLNCVDSNIKSLGGIEQFAFITDLDLSQTAVDCRQVSDFSTQNPTINVTAPSVCRISNINFPDPAVAACVNNYKVTDFVVDMTALECSDMNATDLTGIELLGSLETLNIANTGTDCQSIAMLKMDLSSTEITIPEKCVLNSDTLLTNVPRKYAVYDSEGVATYRIFEDDVIQGCFDNDVADKGYTTLGEYESLFCNDKGATSIGGVENLVAMNTLNIRNFTITDFSPMFNLSDLTKLELRYTTDINDEQLKTISDALGEQLQILSLAGTKVLNFTYISEFTALKELNLSQTNKTFDLVDKDWGSLDEMTNLTKIIFKKTPLVTLEPLLTLPNLTDLTLQSTTQPGQSEVKLACSELDKLLAVNPVLKEAFDTKNAGIGTLITDAKTCY